MKHRRNPLLWAAISGTAVFVVGIASGNITLFLTALVVWNIVFIRMMILEALE